MMGACENKSISFPVVTSSEVTYLDLFVQVCLLKLATLALGSAVLDGVSGSTDSGM